MSLSHVKISLKIPFQILKAQCTLGGKYYELLKKTNKEENTNNS